MAWGLAQISAYELTEWQVFAELEPFGSEWMDTRFAMLASLIANANRDPKKHKQPFKLQDFMLVQPVEKKPERSLMDKFKDSFKR